jgi:hypothetical protein
VPPREIRFALTETERTLRAIVREDSWQAIHVSGVDTHQASSVIDGFYDALEKKPAVWQRIADADGRVKDGMILRESNVSELAVPYDELAAILVNARRPPSLVTLNLYHSGARIARELVTQGANAAIGFSTRSTTNWRSSFPIVLLGVVPSGGIARSPGLPGRVASHAGPRRPVAWHRHRDLDGHQRLRRPHVRR